MGKREGKKERERNTNETFLLPLHPPAAPMPQQQHQQKTHARLTEINAASGNLQVYTMQRYLQYETLFQNGLHHFDAWASTFGETTTAIEDIS